MKNKIEKEETKEEEGIITLPSRDQIKRKATITVKKNIEKPMTLERYMNENPEFIELKKNHEEKRAQYLANPNNPL